MLDVFEFLFTILDLDGPTIRKDSLLCFEVPKRFGQDSPLIERTDASLEIRLLERPLLDECLGFFTSRKSSEKAQRAAFAANRLICMSKVVDYKAVG
jgi:hypothetical protein